MQPEDVALSNCDREPVHIPGRIQSFGTLLGFDVGGEKIRHAAANFHSIFPELGSDPLNEHINDVLGDPTFIHDLRGALGLAALGMHRERMGSYELVGAHVDVAAHRQGDMAIVEFEPLTELDDRPDSAITHVRSMLAGIRVMESVTNSLELAVEDLRRLTGFDRVMAYHFLPNGDGEVMAEARGPGVEPFLGLRYPAWDIPAQVREIALRMPFRMIADVNDPHVPVIAGPGMTPLDLTLAHLRGVSPVHIEYLKNMGVGASMNSSIIVRGALWGLFAFHHYRPKALPPNSRTVCEMFTLFFSSHLEQQLERESTARAKRAHAVLVSLESADELSLSERFDELAPAISQALELDGVALETTSGVKTFGHVPDKDAIHTIGNLAKDQMVSIDSLVASGIANERLGGVAGAIIIPFAHDELSRLIFFRNEISTAIRWAGTREKTIEYGPLGPRLHPRSSFEEYKESVYGRCREWTRADMAAAGEVRSLVLEALNRNLSTSDREWRKQRKQQDLLVAELNHRVKNILALVRSIASQTRESAGSLAEYIEAFENRIRALAFAHDLVGGRSFQQASLAELVRAELRPYAADRVKLDGEPVALRPEAAPVIALVLHELASNAAKYGALSRDGGSLCVRWKDDAGGLAILWDEKVTRKLTPPTRRGFGTALVERAIPFECGGESKVQFRPDGLSVRLWLPQTMLTRYEATAEVKSSPAQPTPTAVPAARQYGRALVVEDNMILTMELEELLTTLGFAAVDSMPNNTKAWGLLKSKSYAVAILDINLAGQTSFELAELALKHKVPVIFVTGYGAHVDVPESLAGVPRLSKPVDRNVLAAQLHQLKIGGQA